jgi:serine/threonine protein kinase
MKKIKILRMMDHKNVIKLFEVYEDNKYIFLIFEFIHEGCL